MLRVGTCGFSYDDWRGAWYPPDLPRSRYFDYYAERFSAVEIDSTFYHIYRPQMMQSLVRRAAGRVAFAVKMTAMVTHQSLLTRPVILSYAAGIAPAAGAGVLAAVLLQFPQRFHWNHDNRIYLEKVMQAFAAFPLVLEIRHQSWRAPDAWRYIHDHAINLCLTDAPALPALPRRCHAQTGPIAYVRFHGRNAAQWYGESYPGGRYDYFYSKAELQSWIAPIQTLTRKSETALAFFNNHVRAQAPANAEIFLSLQGATIPKPSYSDLFSTQTLSA